jgi:hypothetical protein
MFGRDAIDIARRLVIAYMHGMEEGTDKRVDTDSGVFKERFKASFKVAPVLVAMHVSTCILRDTRT